MTKTKDTQLIGFEIKLPQDPSEEILSGKQLRFLVINFVKLMEANDIPEEFNNILDTASYEGKPFDHYYDLLTAQMPFLEKRLRKEGL